MQLNLSGVNMFNISIDDTTLIYSRSIDSKIYNIKKDIEPEAYHETLKMLKNLSEMSNDDFKFFSQIQAQMA